MSRVAVDSCHQLLLGTVCAYEHIHMAHGYVDMREPSCKQSTKDGENLAVDPKAMEQLAKEPVVLRPGFPIFFSNWVNHGKPQSYSRVRGINAA